MGDRSKIEWTDATWGPVTGCTKVSEGCDHCYAETIAHRFAGTKAYPNGFDVTLRPERLDQPLRWQRPRRIFVNSMSDLFHKDVPDEYIARVFAVMALSPHHTFQVLTKRPGRMRSLLSQSPGGPADSFVQRVKHHMWEMAGLTKLGMAGWHYRIDQKENWWPLDNVWLGASVENQKWAGIRTDQLRATPAAVRFLSCEPLLGSVILCRCDGTSYESQRRPFIVNDACPLHGSVRLDWVIVGGESGPHARPMYPAWARSLRDQCTATGVAYLFKQWGEWAPCSETAAEADDVFRFPDGEVMRRVGRREAGRELDGKTWDEYPVDDRWCRVSEIVDYTVLCVHTCWGSDHTAPVGIRRRVQLKAGGVRHEGTRCDGTPIALIEGGQGWADLATSWSNPCPCWERGQHAHRGHCCFDQDICVEHDELARAWLEGVANRDEGDRW